MFLYIQVIGGFSVAVDGLPVAAELWRRDRAAALVKLLAVTPGHRMHREKIIDLFWPDADLDQGGASLRKAVHFARRAMGSHELIETTGDVVALPAELSVDADLFEAAATSALRGSDPQSCAAAADLCPGSLLPDDQFVDWLDTPRAAMHQRLIDVLRAGRLWQRLIEIEPTDEPAQCAMMENALASGNRAEAIRIFNQLRDRLHFDIGVGPSAEAVRLYDRALAVPAVDPVSQTDRIRAALAWGLLHLQSGEFDKAAEVATETRALAMAAGLPREVGEASALLGLSAHMQGRWNELFRAEFIEWVRAEPRTASPILEGHLCLAEFCLCNSKGHHQIGMAAQELLSVAEGAGSPAGRGLASMVLGAVALCSGQTAEAERLLTEADAQLASVDAAAGRVLALERLAEIAIDRGQLWQAGRLVQRAAGVARGSWLVMHLDIRLAALAVRLAKTEEEMDAAILKGDRLLSATQGGMCQPCSMPYRMASAIALAERGETQQVGRRLDEMERIAGMWHGGPWVAATWEARGVQRRAEGNEGRASAAFEEAASRYADLGRPADEARCRKRQFAS